ncbi:Enolase-phosphatase E1 [Nannochloropsis gaditana]|uniref:Probable methylthioribulose-1-phosphate dehydratase n=1 Tax=Nannochloropsis gaditana TaxID=72520 RepID=W7TPD7_9STRA|nr:Enolase-phosphatase E1 [Nannochloropsis gaditana]
MRAWYLNDPHQACTPAILEELGACVGKAFEPDKGSDTLFLTAISEKELGAAFADTLKEFGREHCMGAVSEVQDFNVVGGQVYIDVRDSADAWIRVLLFKEDRLTLPSSVWRRLVPTTEDIHVDVAIASRPDPSNGVSKAASNGAGRKGGSAFSVKTYRFASPADERRAMAVWTQRRGQDGGTRQLIVDLCRQFYDLGWVTGTGGSISIREGNRVFMTPSGVQKERILPEELYILDMRGNHLYVPPESQPGRSPLKLTACAPLFFHTYRIRDAGAVIHSHGMDCVLATLLQGEDATEFQITHQEMIKGIAGHGYRSTLVIPIIENTPHEADLADSLADAIRRYPETTAVLVRRHGIYIWGKTWMQAKTQAECYHYLFRLAVEMHRLGIDYTATPRGDGATLSPAMLTKEKEALLARGEGMGCCSGAGGGELQGSHALNGSHENAGRYEKSGIKHVLMDIEGTTTSIDFVHQVLFPYASAQVGAHVREKLAENDPEVLGDIQALRDGCPEGCPPIPEEGGEGGREGLMEAVVKNVRWQMERDLKTTALKRLQGHIWRAGYAKGALHSHVYEDVPGALARWTQGGKGGWGA